MRTPRQLYVSSPRAYPARLPQPEYGSALRVRRVHPHGQFVWKGQEVFLSKVLCGENIGLLPLDERYYRVYFAALPLACFDSYELEVQPLPPEHADDEDS